MAQSDIRIKVTVDTGTASAKVDKVTESTKKLGDTVSKANAKVSKASKATKGLGKASANAQEAIREMAASIAVMQGPLGPVAGRLNSLGAILGRVTPVGLAATAAFATIGATLTKASKAGAAYESQMAKLEAIIKSTGGAAGFSAEEIDKFAIKLGIDTLTSAEAVRDAAGILATFKSITGDAFTQTLTLAQDLSATGFGDLKTATLGLAKALEDPIVGLSALRRSGVTFNEVQKDMIKGLVESGEKLKAQEIILKAVNEQVGGAGIGQAKGLKGSFDSFGEAVTNASVRMNELFGFTDSLARVFNTLTDAVNASSDAIAGLFSSGTEEGKAFAGTVEDIQGKIDGLKAQLFRQDGTLIDVPGAEESLKKLSELEAKLKQLKENQAAGIPLVDEKEVAKQIAAQQSLIEAAALQEAKLDAIRSSLFSASERAVANLTKQQDEVSKAIANAQKQLAGAIKFKGETDEEFEARKAKLVEREQQLQELRLQIAKAGAERLNQIVLGNTDTSDNGASKIEALRQQLRTETEVILEQLKERQSLVNEQLAQENDPEKRAELLNLRIEAEQEAANKLNAIDIKRASFKKKLDLDVANSSLQLLGAFGKKSKKFQQALFLAEKTAAIAGIYVKSVEAAEAAGRQAAVIGGAPAYAAAKAKVLLSGRLSMAAVAASAIGSVGSVGAGSGGTVAAPAPTPQPLFQPQDQREIQSVNITLVGEERTTSFTAGQVRDLIDAINEQVGDGVDLNVRVAN